MSVNHLQTKNMFFERAIEVYDVLYSFEKSYETELLSRILETCNKTETFKFLDLGGGSGIFADLVKQYTNWDIVVGDYSEKLLQSAKIKNLKTALMDINDLSLDEKYDIVLCKYCIHYVKNYPLFYKAMHQLLNENGKIYIISRPQVTEFPFTEKLHKQWKESQPSPSEFLNTASNFFRLKMEFFSFPVEMKQKEWNNIILNKAMSHIKDDDANEVKLFNEEDTIKFFENIIFVETF